MSVHLLWCTTNGCPSVLSILMEGVFASIIILVVLHISSNFLVYALQVHYKQLMTLVETARAEYDARVSAQNTDDHRHRHDDVATETKDLPKCDQVEADIPSGSSSESSDSEGENDVAEQELIMSTPWKIFFEHPADDPVEVVKQSESAPLNVNASEFVPSFKKLNVDAKEFIPFL